VFPDPLPPDGRLSPSNRLDVVVVAVVLLFAALGLGFALTIGGDRPPIARVAGVLLILGTIAGFVVLFRWAGQSRFRYDQSSDSVRTSEVILVCAVAIFLFGVLYEPAGPAALLVFVAATGFLVCVQLRRSRAARSRRS
jgi:hypothetical protein